MPRELTKLVIEEVSAVDAPANPGARVVLLKRDPIADLQRRVDALLTKSLNSPAPVAVTQKEAPMSLENEVKKALEGASSDVQAIVKAQLAAGVSITKVAAELALEAKAEALRKAQPHLTPAQAYAQAFEDPDSRVLREAMC